MITITPEGNGHKVLLSHPGTNTRGVSFHAKSIDEVHEAIDHYHAHGEHKRDHANNRRRETCPICRSHVLQVDPGNEGKRVEIIAVTNPDVNGRRKMIGRVGIIKKAVKSRNVYVLVDHQGEYLWESQPENVKIVSAAVPTISRKVDVANYYDGTGQLYYPSYPWGVHFHQEGSEPTNGGPLSSDKTKTKTTACNKAQCWCTEKGRKAVVFRRKDGEIVAVVWNDGDDVQIKSFC